MVRLSHPNCLSWTDLTHGRILCRRGGYWSWLPFLWSRVLFPGRAEPISAAWRWAPFLVLCVVSSALLYPYLSFFLFEPDEGRYAQIPREMLSRGDWIVPTLQGEPYLDKPPRFYWLVMGAFQLFGFHDWAARLIPALAIQGCILMTYFFGRRLLGERPAFWGRSLLALLPGFVGMGRLLVLDGVLTFWVTLVDFQCPPRGRERHLAGAAGGSWRRWHAG